MRSTVLPCVGAAAAFLLTVFSFSVSAETYYRWVNERGFPVHSDRPPPAGTDYEVISTGSKLKRQVQAEVGAVPPEVEPRVGNEFEPVTKGPANVSEKKNPELCKRAQENLQALNTRAVIRVRDEQGEFFFLDDEARAEQIEEAEAIIEKHCE